MSVAISGLRRSRSQRTGRVRAGVRPPGEPRRVAYLYLAPALVFYFVLVLVPLLCTVGISFFQWDGIGAFVWTGLGNYATVLSDPDTSGAFAHAFELILFYSVIPVCAGLVLASILARGHLRGVSFFRTVLFLPQTLATVVVAIAWSWNYQLYGPINQVLSFIGLGSINRAWLGDFDWALPALGLIGSWVTLGLCLVLFLAGMQKIPTELYEAANLDGAGRVTEFLAVTLPALRGEIAVVLTLTTIAALRTFDLVYVATHGGPGSSTLVPSYFVYTGAFQNGLVGLAAAVAVVLTILIFVVVGTIVRIVDRDPTV